MRPCRIRQQCRNYVTFWSDLILQRLMTHAADQHMVCSRRLRGRDSMKCQCPDGDIGAARLPAGWQVWWLRFRMMIERGPRERPQASEEKRTWNIMPD